MVKIKIEDKFEQVSSLTFLDPHHSDQFYQQTETVVLTSNIRRRMQVGTIV